VNAEVASRVMFVGPCPQVPLAVISWSWISISITTF